MHHQRLQITVHEFQKKYERKGHQKAELRAGQVKNLSTTGWGLFGEIEYPLVIRDIYLAPTSTTAGDPGKIASDLAVLKISTCIKLSILDLPPEVLLHVFEQLDPYDEPEGRGTYGRAALALSCKSLAQVSKKTKVLKTEISIPTKGYTKLCVGCGKARSMIEHHWQGKEEEIKRDWVSSLGDHPSYPPRLTNVPALHTYATTSWSLT